MYHHYALRFILPFKHLYILIFYIIVVQPNVLPVKYEPRYEKTCLWIQRNLANMLLDPLRPHFYVVKLGFAGVYIILFLL